MKRFTRGGNENLRLAQDLHLLNSINRAQPCGINNSVHVRHTMKVLLDKCAEGRVLFTEVDGGEEDVDNVGDRDETG